MLEAITLCEEIAGRELSWTLDATSRTGDHRWWISDLSEFRTDYPAWEIEFGVAEILRQIYEHNLEQGAVAS
jgi:CDP-paratose 2-epimerase